MKNQNIFYSIWAIFNNKEEKQLSNLKHKINKKLNGPYFPIHMTISAGFVGEETLTNIIKIPIITVSIIKISSIKKI